MTHQAKRTPKLLLVLALIAVASVTGWQLLHAWSRHSAYAASEVQAGVLYRSGQPQGKALNALRDRYHVRTVINLRGDAPGEPWWKVEEEFCLANDIRLVNIALSPEGFTQPQMAQFLAIVQDPVCQPVLVHCEHGRNRTGYAVAVFHIAVQHWSYEAALAEAREYGFPERAHGYEEYLRALAAGNSPLGPP